ncbi:hypothetical protein NDU88_006453 [Pleurodeles waltl]|uniref:Uncharacterized protein n=1 Tax=Pleurodeles waltl TaxID=8319 RepID=A0AAV7VP58_PLEWA|nr:hypothetical protein NDU88_006453 [Pleurodeles waltl]
MRPKVSFKHKVPGFWWKISAEGRRRGDAWKNGVCGGYAPSHTDLRRYFSRGETGVILREEKWCVRRLRPFTHRLASLFFTRGRRASFSSTWTVSFYGSRGLPDVPGLCVDSPACFPAARRSTGLCAEISLSQQASRRFLLGSRAALSLRGRASKFRLSRRRRVDQRRCAAFFSPRNKLCVENFGARSVQVKKISLFGPETSGNRRQALSKPLESTFTARQEFSKAAGQQQGSSPL